MSRSHVDQESRGAATLPALAAAAAVAEAKGNNALKCGGAPSFVFAALYLVVLASVLRSTMTSISHKNICFYSSPRGVRALCC